MVTHAAPPLSTLDIPYLLSYMSVVTQPSLTHHSVSFSGWGGVGEGTVPPFEGEGGGVKTVSHS